MLILLLAIVGQQVAANYLALARKGLELRFASLLLLNYGHYLVLLLFDTLVIDGLTSAYGGPRFSRFLPAWGPSR